MARAVSRIKDERQHHIHSSGQPLERLLFCTKSSAHYSQQSLHNYVIHTRAIHKRSQAAIREGNDVLFLSN